MLRRIIYCFMYYDCFVVTVLLRTVQAKWSNSDVKWMSQIPWYPLWVAVLAFQWGLCCLLLPVWHLPTSWLHSAFWCKDGKSAFAHARLCSSNLREKHRVKGTQWKLRKFVKCKWYRSRQQTEGDSDHELTSVLEDLLIRLHHRAETVEDQSSQFGSTALRWLVIVQRVTGKSKPALLQLQRRAFGSWLHLFMQPAWEDK